MKWNIIILCANESNVKQKKLTRFVFLANPKSVISVYCIWLSLEKTSLDEINAKKRFI